MYIFSNMHICFVLLCFVLCCLKILVEISLLKILDNFHTFQMFPAHKTLKSITAMLTCYGFDGSALFRDTTINPIFGKRHSISFILFFQLSFYNKESLSMIPPTPTHHGD